VFDIGPGEFIAIAVVALLVLGPEKLPRYAADAARFVRQIRRMANDARAEVTKELGPELDGLNLRDINPRALVKKHVIDGLGIEGGLGLDDDDDEAPAPRRVNGAAGTTSNGTAAAPDGDAPAAPAQRPAFDPDTT
jgi:sec-independent protein translocase protein TatB